MKIIRSHIAPRVIIREYNKQFGILPYDIDNVYPQRITDIVNSSGTAKTCIGLYSKFIEGNGFKDQVFYKAIVNSRGLTLDKLLRKVATDYANRNGFAIHINYNGMLQVSDMRPIPFHDCRLGHPLTENAGKIAVYDDWYQRKRPIHKLKIQFYDSYSADPNVIQNQIDKAGGIENWKGQILWHSSEGEDYPLAPYDAVIFDIETEGRISSYKRKKSANGWNADFAIVFKGKFETETEKNDTKKELEAYQGDEAGAAIPMFEAATAEEVPTFLPFPKISADKDFYNSNETSVQNNIRKAFGFPPALTGELIPGKLGMAQEILDSTALVNGLTNKERRIFEETFQMLFSNWHIPALQANPTNNYSIIPLQLISSEATKEVSIGEQPASSTAPAA